MRTPELPIGGQPHSRTRCRTSGQGAGIVLAPPTLKTMSTGKLITLSVAWVLASLTMGVVVAVLVTEILRLVGIVETGSPGYATSLNVVTFGTFAVLLGVPFVFRKRFIGTEDDGDE